MLETTGNLWDVQGADALCITTNGYVTKDGHATMGAGCALEARSMFDGISKVLGSLLNTYKNHVYELPGYEHNGARIVTFPVKHHWKDRAAFDLIFKSTHELKNLTDARGWQNVVLPRPGCGNGHRTWEQVKPILEPILDDRFTVITF